VGKKRDGRRSEHRIRLYPIYRRMTNSSGITIKLCDTPLDTAVMSICDSLCIVHAYDPLDGIFARDNAIETCKLMTQRECPNPEILFMGELIRGERILFEGRSDPDRAFQLRKALGGVFGYQPLPEPALQIFSLDPLVCIGSYEIGHLQALLANHNGTPESRN
jgi:hypothetical protein